MITWRFLAALLVLCTGLCWSHGKGRIVSELGSFCQIRENTVILNLLWLRRTLLIKWSWYIVSPLLKIWKLNNVRKSHANTDHGPTNSAGRLKIDLIAFKCSNESLCTAWKDFKHSVCYRTSLLRKTTNHSHNSLPKNSFHHTVGKVPCWSVGRTERIVLRKKLTFAIDSNGISWDILVSSVFQPTKYCVALYVRWVWDVIDCGW